jgi:hypothetical protein
LFAGIDGYLIRAAGEIVEGKRAISIGERLRVPE